MPKMKTKSSAKKRFKITATGKVLSPQANKRHNMRKRSNRQIRDQRGTVTLPDMEAKRVKSYMPYGS
jgi:large subunit ribosomal protein L35